MTLSQLAIPMEKLGYDNAARSPVSEAESGPPVEDNSAASTSASPVNDEESQQVEVKGVPVWSRIRRFLQVCLCVHTLYPCGYYETVALRVCYV